jgi:hypothetical protein
MVGTGYGRQESVDAAPACLFFNDLPAAAEFIRSDAAARGCA